MKSNRSKACDISQSTKKKVWQRDDQRCVCCGSSSAMPNAHFISRAKGGMGIEENIVTLCANCHRCFDHTDERPEYRNYIRAYLKTKYPNWNEESLVYRKWNDGKVL